MNNRIDEHSNEPFGLEGWLESTRVLLPLRSVSVNAEVAAGFATVEMDQLFEQSNENPLDCRYVFPLPADAAVYRCEMHVNGRMILAKVEERSAARKLYNKAKAEGRRAAMAESERENLFTLQLGNLQPGDSILMRFAYVQPVQRLREQRTLRVPVNPGVRYIPGEPLLRGNHGPGVADDTSEVPEASFITPPRIDRDHPDAAGLSVRVRLHGENGIADSVSSPTHMIVVRGDNADLTAALAVDHNVPDRDFVISWKEPKPHAAIARAWLDSGRRGVLELRLPVGEQTSAPSADIYFLLDCSGSMEGSNWDGACKALTSFLPRLGPDTRVWITLFESKVHDHDSKLVSVGDLDLEATGEKIHKFGTHGGTELLPALRHIGRKIREHSSGKDSAVLLITDGQIGNEQQIQQEAASLGCPIHIIGVAMTMNDALGSVASATGGRSVFLAPGEDISAAVERFAPVLRAPVVTGLSLPSGWTTPDGSKLRDLVDGDDVVVPISATKDAPQFGLTGIKTDGSPWAVTRSENSLPGAGLVWARARVRHLDAKRRRSDSLAVAKEFNILSEQSAFIAWDESEKVPVAQTDLFQPAMEIAGDVQIRYSLCPPEDYCCSEAPPPRRGKRSPGGAPAPRKAKQPTVLPTPVWFHDSAELHQFLEKLRIELEQFYEPDNMPTELRQILDDLRTLVEGTPDQDFANIAVMLLERLVNQLTTIRKQEHNLLRKLRLVAGINRRADEALHHFKSKTPLVHT